MSSKCPNAFSGILGSYRLVWRIFLRKLLESWGARDRAVVIKVSLYPKDRSLICCDASLDYTAVNCN